MRTGLSDRDQEEAHEYSYKRITSKLAFPSIFVDENILKLLGGGESDKNKELTSRDRSENSQREESRILGPSAPNTDVNYIDTIDRRIVSWGHFVRSGGRSGSNVKGRVEERSAMPFETF